MFQFFGFLVFNGFPDEDLAFIAEFFPGWIKYLKLSKANCELNRTFLLLAFPTVSSNLSLICSTQKESHMRPLFMFSLFSVCRDPHMHVPLWSFSALLSLLICACIVCIVGAMFLHSYK